MNTITIKAIMRRFVVMCFHSLRADEVLSFFKSSIKYGLSDKQVESALSRYGLNKLKQKKKKGLFIKFIQQLSDFMTILLIIAAVVSFITVKLENSNDYIDSIIIIAIVILNAVIGVIQESKAERAIEELQKMSTVKVIVRRNGREFEVASEYLVPGDIILLETGDYVPADARLLKTFNLSVKEDMLTGESIPVEKDETKLLKENTEIYAQSNMVFSGSFVVSGRAIAVVTKTGMQTAMGKIAYLIDNEREIKTPLQQILAKYSKYLGIGAIVICLIIFILGLLQNINPLEMFIISISLAVAAIPEGLPAVVTIVLAVGVRRLANHNAIVKKLPAVETLGRADVICSDKTGTLTENKMQVRKIADFSGYIRTDSETAKIVAILATLCSNAQITRTNKKIISYGDPTEQAIVLYAASLGENKSKLDKEFVRIGEKPFDSRTKMMSTIHRTANNSYRIICKGATDVLLNKCDRFLDNGKILKIGAKEREMIRQNNENMASHALRVIAVAYKDKTDKPSSSEIETNLIFVGLIGLMDPPRKEVKQAVYDCKCAGIKPVMITGDHITTAKAVAKEIGICTDSDEAINATKLDKLSQKELENRIEDYSVFARVSPEHKVRIVKAYQKKGKIVAMTGDGVNDAPALKVADIGCSMGKNGTAVAREASDMILTDDNFATIVNAVKQGRTVLQNIRKTIHFLLSSNIGEIITVFVAFLLKLPTPLLAIQLLWVNLVTDSLPALALGVDAVDKNIMNKKHKESNNGKLFTKQMSYEIAIEGCFIGSISLLAFTIGRVFFDMPGSVDIGRTMAFSVLSLSQLVHAFNVRSDLSIFKIGIMSNKIMVLSFVVCVALQIAVVSVPVLSALFKTQALNLEEWGIVFLLSISPLVLVEIEKLIFNRQK